jgi:hypothetical protein
MTVDEAIEDFKQHLDKMAAEWKEQSELKPEEWPALLPEGEWFEQILAHISMNWSDSDEAHFQSE